VSRSGNGGNRYSHPVSKALVGWARSTDEQDLTAQRDALVGLDVDPKRIYVDHGAHRRNRARPGLRDALVACHAGDGLYGPAGDAATTAADRSAADCRWANTRAPLRAPSHPGWPVCRAWSVRVCEVVVRRIVCL
jgi:hypothetical protein